MTQLFEFTDYRSYLKAAIKDLKKAQRGVQSRFAEALNCRPGYVTQILSDTSDLSLEQANSASQFFAHTEDEEQYFLLLVIYARAGTESLRGQIAKQLQVARERHLNLKQRFEVKTISDESQSVFYSSWHYLAMLSCIGIAEFKTKEAISRQLNIPLKKTADVLAQLENFGLIKVVGGKYLPGTTRTHLGKDSPMLSKHHLNWRIRAMDSIERQREHDLHYSSVVTLSEKDFHVVRERLVQVIEEIAVIVQPSAEERLCSLCLDFFDICGPV